MNVLFNKYILISIDLSMDKKFIRILFYHPLFSQVYMTYVQAMYGGGGWPLSVFLSPNLKPFMGGTYFPPDDKYGRPGFKTVLRWVKFF